MNIFIAGCARSGTSMTRGLMSCFEGVYAHGGFSESRERPASDFEKLAGEAPHIVLKRTADCHRSLARLRADVALLYCVRHPYDVLTSTHRETRSERRFHVSPRRWRAEYRALRRLRVSQPRRRIFILRYEDLIRDPDGTQQRVADHFGLVPACRFSSNPDGVRIQADSIEKWRRFPDLLDYLETLRRPDRDAIDRFCAEFGYSLPKPTTEPARSRALSFRQLVGSVLVRKREPRIQRLAGNPIIRPEMLPGRDGVNINGPSLIAAPGWLPGRLGKYYLYFADHRGTYIRLAYADRLEGPWAIYKPGTLRLDEAPMCREHIASPDVHVDEEARKIRMYFHGPLVGSKDQRSFAAISTDGIGFTASKEILAGPYLRCVQWDGGWLGMDMEGGVYRSGNGLTGFERSPADLHFPFPRRLSLRHVALRIVGSTLEIYYTRRGDAPERIWRCQVNLTQDWTTWHVRDVEPVVAPETDWEGANIRRRRSKPGPSKGLENALRDPAVFVENGTAYLLYAVAGEAGIAIAELL